MSNVARSQDVKEGKEAASRTVSTLLLQRHAPCPSKGEAGQDLQDLYKVPRKDVSSGVGAYWLNMIRGDKVQCDMTLAGVAHAAVLAGQITHNDYPLLKLFPGGVRLLQMIGHLLIESHAGIAVDQQKVAQSLTAWYRALGQCEVRRSEERRDLWIRRASAREVTDSALDLVSECLRAPEMSELLQMQGVAKEKCRRDVGTGAAEDPLSQCAGVLRARREALAVVLKRLAKALHQERRSAGSIDVAGVEQQNSSVAASLVTIKTHESLLSDLRNINKYVGFVLRAVDRLKREAKASKCFDLQCMSMEHYLRTVDKAKDAGPDAPSANPLELLREAIAAVRECLSVSLFEEKYSAGFADLPSIKPQGPNVAASLDFMHQQLLDIIAVEWEDDPEHGEIVVEDLGDCFEIQPEESEPKLLVWVRRTEALSGAEAL